MCETASEFRKEFKALNKRENYLKIKLNKRIKLLAKKYLPHDEYNDEMFNSCTVEQLLSHLIVLENKDDEENSKRQLKLFK